MSEDSSDGVEISAVTRALKAQRTPRRAPSRPAIPALDLSGSSGPSSPIHAECVTCGSDRLVDLYRGRVNHCLKCETDWIPAHGKAWCRMKKCGLTLVIEPRFAELYYVCLACKSIKEVGRWRA